MTSFLLDTDSITHYLRNHPLLLGNVAASLAPIQLPIIALEEIWDGWSTAAKRARDNGERGQAYDRLAGSLNRLRHWPIMTISAAAWDRYDALKKLKLNVRAGDLKIGAMALEEGATVVTRNLHDFQRIPNLVVVNWIDPAP